VIKFQIVINADLNISKKRRTIALNVKSLRKRLIEFHQQFTKKQLSHQHPTSRPEKSISFLKWILKQFKGRQPLIITDFKKPHKPPFPNSIKSNILQLIYSLQSSLIEGISRTRNHKKIKINMKEDKDFLKEG
jgi:hypothetical protein